MGQTKTSLYVKKTLPFFKIKLLDIPVFMFGSFLFGWWTPEVGGCMGDIQMVHTAGFISAGRTLRHVIIAIFHLVSVRDHCCIPLIQSLFISSNVLNQ